MKSRANYEAKAQAAKASRQASQRKVVFSDAWFDPAVDPRFLETLAAKARA